MIADMQAENWKIASEVLQEVLELPASERNNFLEKANLSAEVKAEVESLLALEESAGEFMSVSAGGLTGEMVFEKESSENLLVGQRVGIYEIEKELGLGGMGAVYLADRADGKFKQKVALKMLKREFNVKKIRRNFEREREILSKLEHPNIARLLDAGTTEDGIPFLAVEYVEGVSIDKFCTENSLELNARLKLFNKVCEAVSFAHRNLIIHRDLKPSNIIVNNKGEPKLLDFGISKLLDETHGNTVTMFGAMTPEYASPEQIKGETVTTATDIYSLGVVLYKMLTGNLPYDFRGKTNGNILKTITENEPVKPSAIQISNSDNPQVKIQNLQLKGDLDNILLKSLSKEPERRYQTVQEFSADIWRFIDGLPITARPATFTYRTNKFIKRNKISVIAGVLIFLSLVTGIWAAMRQTKIANEQARIASESQNLAQKETAKAKVEQEKSEKVTKFMSKIIGYANPNWYAEGAKFGKDARVIDAIVEMGDKIDVEFADEPDVAAELHHRFLDGVLPNAGSLGAEEHKKRKLFHAYRALELRKQFYGEKHELVAKDMVYLYWARGSDDPNRASYLMSAITMMRETNPNNLNLPYMLEDYTSRLIFPEHESVHELFLKAVVSATNENRYEIAEKMLRESLPVFRLHYKPDNSAIYSTECKLAYTLAKQENRKDFDEHYSICKRWFLNSTDPNIKKIKKYSVDLIEKALSEKQKN
ncbi:MAG: protein kinase [Pyrinomonadaceae bacterium]